MRRLTPINRSVSSLGLAWVVAAAAQLPLLAIGPTDYERELLAERRSIAQLHLEIDTDFRHGSSGRFTRMKRTIWQDGDKRRCDELREYIDEKGETEVPPYRIVYIETPEYIIFWDGKPQPPPSFKWVAAHFELPSSRNAKGFKRFHSFDFRSIGLRWSFTLHQGDEPWYSIVGTPDRTAPASIELNGDQVKVSFTHVNKVGTKIAIEQFYEKRGEKSLLRRVGSNASSEDKSQITVECNYPETLIGGFAFPNAVEVKVVQGDRIVILDNSVIRLKSINESLPASKFSIEDAELPKGTMVTGDAIPPELRKPFHHIQWDGQALVPVSNEEIVLSKEPDKPKWSVGQIAPPIEGEDLAGNPLRLEDYRGKVVLLVFWGSWCGPCMAMVPHERKLHEQYQGRPFELLGVNCGDAKEKAKVAVEANSMAWRSWWGGESLRGPIDKNYDIRYWPTTFVIDAEGKFRAIDLRGEELDNAIEAAVTDAEKNNGK